MVLVYSTVGIHLPSPPLSLSLSLFLLVCSSSCSCTLLDRIHIIFIFIIIERAGECIKFDSLENVFCLSLSLFAFKFPLKR